MWREPWRLSDVDKMWEEGGRENQRDRAVRVSDLS